MLREYQLTTNPGDESVNYYEDDKTEIVILGNDDMQSKSFIEY